MSSDVITEFLGAMRKHGLEPVEQIIADGQLHRCGWAGDKPGTRNGAYLLHLNGRPAGFVQCHKRDIRFNWTANGRRLSPAERTAFARQSRRRSEAARAGGE